jgi:hypothetical protein
MDIYHAELLNGDGDRVVECFALHPRVCYDEFQASCLDYFDGDDFDGDGPPGFPDLAASPGPGDTLLAEAWPFKHWWCRLRCRRVHEGVAP